MWSSRSPFGSALRGSARNVNILSVPPCLQSPREITFAPRTPLREVEDRLEVVETRMATAKKQRAVHDPPRDGRRQLAELLPRKKHMRIPPSAACPFLDERLGVTGELRGVFPRELSGARQS